MGVRWGGGAGANAGAWGEQCGRGQLPRVAANMRGPGLTRHAARPSSPGGLQGWRATAEVVAVLEPSRRRESVIGACASPAHLACAAAPLRADPPAPLTPRCCRRAQGRGQRLFVPGALRPPPAAHGGTARHAAPCAARGADGGGFAAGACWCACCGVCGWGGGLLAGSRAVPPLPARQRAPPCPTPGRRLPRRGRSSARAWRRGRGDTPSRRRGCARACARVCARHKAAKGWSRPSNTAPLRRTENPHSHAPPPPPPPPPCPPPQPPSHARRCATAWGRRGAWPPRLRRCCRPRA